MMAPMNIIVTCLVDFNRSHQFNRGHQFNRVHQPVEMLRALRVIVTTTLCGAFLTRGDVTEIKTVLMAKTKKTARVRISVFIFP